MAEARAWELNKLPYIDPLLHRTSKNALPNIPKKILKLPISQITLAYFLLAPFEFLSSVLLVSEFRTFVYVYSFKTLCFHYLQTNKIEFMHKANSSLTSKICPQNFVMKFRNLSLILCQPVIFVTIFFWILLDLQSSVVLFISVYWISLFLQIKGLSYCVPIRTHL